jgi:small conductance mechanosensitive channel
MESIPRTVSEQFALMALRVGMAIIVLLIFWLFAKIADRLITKSTRRLHLNAPIVVLLGRTAKTTLIILGIVTALGTLGINVSALVAGLGLTGFALGFALKDSISNLVAGVLILAYRPFEEGNRIAIAGFEGKVASIDLRYTELDCQGKRILIPNSRLLTDPITVIYEVGS